jgi:transposase
MPEHLEQQEVGAPLRHLTTTDPDPRVRRRAQAVLLVEEGQTLASGARLFHTSVYRVHVGHERFPRAGRAGLLDRPRGGRPGALSDGDRAFLEAALERGPQAYALPITIWSIRDLHMLLARERGVAVSVDTVHRAVHDLGFRSRRPRRDLAYRQDREAVAAASHVLDWLQIPATGLRASPPESRGRPPVPTGHRACRATTHQRRPPAGLPAAPPGPRPTAGVSVLNAVTGELVQLIREPSRQDDCLAFVEALSQVRPDVPKLLIWDNAPPHHPKRVLEAAAAHHITIAWLPFRAPELNPCEDLWRLMKAVVAANRCFQDLDALARHAVAWLDALAAEARLLCSGLLGDKFQWLST